MTLSVKLLLIAALVLGIIIPFGYFSAGRHTKRRYKECWGQMYSFTLVHS